MMLLRPELFSWSSSCILIGSYVLFGVGMPLSAQAAVLVTEIMYNPAGANAGHQWLELSNTGSESVDLSAKDIRLFDASGNHLIKAYAGGSTVLPGGGVAVIAQNPLTFLSSYPGYSGQLLKSSFTLAASGILGVTQTNGVLLDNISYVSTEGARGVGNSLQRLGGTSKPVFVAGAPTPGFYPSKPPVALVAQVKQIPASKGSSKSTNKKLGHQKASKLVTSKTHGKGTLAPADSADAASAGALPEGDDLPGFSFAIPSFAMPYIPLFSSAWFAAFLALLGFSSFSIFVIQKRYPYA